MSWGRDSMYSKFCANKLNSHISKDNHMAASQQVSQLHFLYSFQTVPLCELTCIRVYCTVDFDFFTCVFVELYQFMLCNMTVPVLSPLLSVFLSLSWSALCSPPPPTSPPALRMSLSLSPSTFSSCWLSSPVLPCPDPKHHQTTVSDFFLLTLFQLTYCFIQ